MKELIAAAIIVATLLACSIAQAEPYNGHSMLLVLGEKEPGRFELLATEWKETWDECLQAAMATRGGGVQARCLAVRNPEITAEHQDYLTY